MGQLSRALEGGSEGADIIRFFPRDSPLTIVRAPSPRGAAGPVLRRVLRPDSVRAHLEDTDAGCAFGGALFGMTGGWRYTDRGRFTRQRRDPTPFHSIDWVRERGTWVVRQITEEYFRPRRVLGTAVGEISRDTTAYAWLPEERRYAGGMEWYRTHRPVLVDGRMLMKYGLSRHLSRDELEAVGTLGAVPFFAEKGMARYPDVVYALVGPGEYQPYQRSGDTLEDICGEWW